MDKREQLPSEWIFTPLPLVDNFASIPVAYILPPLPLVAIFVHSPFENIVGLAPESVEAVLNQIK